MKIYYITCYLLKKLEENGLEDKFKDQTVTVIKNETVLFEGHLKSNLYIVTFYVETDTAVVNPLFNFSSTNSL